MSSVKEISSKPERQIVKIKNLGAKGIYGEYNEIIKVDRYEEHPGDQWAGSGGVRASGLEIEPFESKTYTCNTKKTYEFLPHKDFLDALKMLRKIVIDLCEFKGEWEKFNDYEVLGLSFSGMDSDDTAGVVITASKTTERTDKTFTFNTPFNLLADKNYGDTDKLDQYCAAVRDEFYKYLDGKHAENPQLSLQFEDGNSINMTISTNDN